MPSLQTSSAGFALVALTSWAVAAAHPQTVFDSARLTQLRSQRSDSAHSAMTSFASQFLTTHNVANSGSCPADIASSTIGQVGGYAVLAEILQQNVSDAVTYLNCFCGQSWDTGVDIAEAQQLAAAAIAYDVLYNDGVSSSCATRIATAANDFYSAYSDPSNPNGWWRTDIANNHIAVNMAALGIAAEALKGENANAPTWLSAVDQAYQKIAAVRDQSTDGSWHEGAEYQFFEMHYAALYFLGAARAGNPDRSATQMFLNAGKYFLQKQRPNNPRFITETPGDWNWTRPKFVAVMRFVAGHLASVDPTLAGYAQTVANRWDLQPRASQTFWLNRFEYAMSYALEYVAFDETVAATDPSISLPLANYNDNEGSFMMRSSWGVATSGSDSQGIVLTLKNGYLGGKGMAQAVANCANIPSAGTDWIVNFGHDHYDDFGLYIYGNGGWLLPEATGYNCCGKSGATDPDTEHDSFWHNTVTFDGSSGSNGNGQILDNWLGLGRSSAVRCGNTTDVFFTRVPANPFHHNTQDFAIGQADGSRLYRNVALSRALRTVGFDRETNVIVLSDEIAFSSGTHTIQQHFHSMKAAGSSIDANNWIKLDNSTSGGNTVPVSNTVLAIKVLAPSDAQLSPIVTQASSSYIEWMSPDGLYGHAVVTTPAVTGRRFLEVLWPTDTTNYPSRPSVTALDLNNPDRGLSVAIPSGGTESWVLNTLGTTTVAGALSIGGSTTSDVGVVRYDASGGLMRTMVEGTGARLSDTNGGRLLVDLNGNPGALEVRYETGNTFVVTADQNQTPVPANGQRFFAATAPASVKYNGSTLTGAQYSYDAAAKLVTLAGGSPPPPPPVISGVGASQITSSSAVISWTTDQPSDSQVQYGLSTSYGSSTALDPTLVTSHSQTLTGLSPATTYHYQVTSRNGGGSSSSPDATLTTLPQADFTISAPASASTASGSSANVKVSIGAVNGFTGTVTLSLSGLPAGASGTFNPASVAGSGSSTLTLSSGTAAAGSYPLQITGTSGSLQHSAPLTFTIMSGTYSDAVWVQQLGTGFDEYGWGAATDPSGNIFVTGYTMGSLQGPNQGGQDVAVAKYSPAGALLWTAQLGSAGDEHAYAAATDSSGNLFVAGSTTDAMWSAYNGGAHDGFVAMFGPNGSASWSDTIGTAGDDFAYAIAVDGSGNIYVAGSTTGAFVGSNAGGMDAWIAKYDPSMTPIWIRQFGGIGDEVARGVAVDATGNVYVAGHTTAAFGGAAYNGGAHDAFLVKYDNNGTLQWTMIRGTGGDDVAYAVAIAGANPVICGSTTGNLAFTNQGGYDGWVGEYTAASGIYVLERQIGGAGIDEAFAVAVDASGDIFITGSNNQSMTSHYQAGYDVFVAKYDSGGTRQWIKTLGSAGDEVGLAAAVSATSVYVIGGTTASLAAPSAGGKDIFVAQFPQ